MSESGYYKIDYKVDGEIIKIVPPDKLRQFINEDLDAYVEALVVQIEHDRRTHQGPFP